MGLWNPLNRAMAIAAGAGVLAACYAVAAWGQAGAAQQLMPGGRTLGASGGAPTVTVGALRIPDSAWRHFERAKNAEEHHRDAEFERESAKALEIAPRFAAMYLLRATVEAAARDYEAAVASAQAAANADPGAMWTAVVLAGAYNGMHRFNDALLVLDSKRGFEAETWQAMYERARAEIGLGDVEAAMHWSGTALGTAPAGFLDAHLVRANALLLAGRSADAAAQMDSYLQSKGPKPHRAQVVAARETLTARIAAEQQARQKSQEDARKSALLRASAWPESRTELASR